MSGQSGHPLGLFSVEEKILTLEELTQQCASYRQQGLRLVLCHGAFDLLHPGHLRHLQRAAQEGDRLIVTLTADRFITKGPGRPVFPEHLRAEGLSSLACVHHVAIVHEASGLTAIHAVQPHVYAKGKDYQNAQDDITGNILLEKQAVESHGGILFFTDEVTFSSSSLLNEYFDVFSPITREYLKSFRANHFSEEIVEQLRGLSKLRVLVIGEAIIDEYCYVSPLGQTGKSGNILAVRYSNRELFAGGSLAVANHLAGFAAKVTLLAGIGKDREQEAFIRSKLAANVKPVLYKFEEAPTLVKKRYVSDNNKLFEVYHYDENPLTPAMEESLSQWIRDHGKNFDLVVVPDYGNGFITTAMVQAICDSSRFLAVNTQINSGNRGYHVITRYPRADFVSLNEPEARLAAHNRHSPIGEVAQWISTRLHTTHTAITQGTHGAMLIDNRQGQQLHTPALSTKVVDRIGAGDAFLALASLCLAGGISSETALFIASAAAALDVQIVCNREPVSPVNLIKFINTLLK
ncbi:MAG: adenylyltransferase/cytidyltransferase family protein [Magnetococcales bacterium]|nr:adenylyltransferase/cytidyltransferase family protein [Magnetococcales bacterium]NGZ26287.1 adenylyltransferase/cytidyltransferase family protein [Magnetococcales bacterium]